jgi:hypothetical protein
MFGAGAPCTVEHFTQLGNSDDETRNELSEKSYLGNIQGIMTSLKPTASCLLLKQKLTSNRAACSRPQGAVATNSWLPAVDHDLQRTRYL